MRNIASTAWENKAGFYDESGKKIAENTIKEMIVMLAVHMREHINMIDNIIEANKQ